ncbi:MAG: low molecular weight protein-tyrosine-phosphatase [Cyanobacteriota bacterium]|nr:low molecular weight protein-tyrosine-phosphatase [Cyanobacteriota bacterium]
MTTPYRVLFVCLGNICRSPAAENIMNHLIQQADLQDQIVCDSAGTSAYHIGNPPDRRMTQAGKQRGLAMTGSARQFSRTDFEEFDLILAMDRDNYEAITYLDHGQHYAKKVKMMCEFCQHAHDREVPDPYYGGIDGFNYVLDLLMDACGGLLQHIINTEHLSVDR